MISKVLTISEQSKPLITSTSLISKKSPLEKNITLHCLITDHAILRKTYMYHSFLNLSTPCTNSNIVQNTS